jgi:peptide/nickel transport system permease protein
VSGRYLVRRLLQVVPAVAGILVLTFVLAHVAPNDPARDFAGEGADQAQIDAASTYLGLDRPLPEQLATYVGRIAHGDLGTSFVQRQPVLDLIRDRLGPTLLLTGSALVLSTIGGVALGILSARRGRGAFDAAVSTGTLLAYSLPGFWVAQVAVLTLAVKAGIFPAGGMTDTRGGFTGIDATQDVVRHLILPALVLAVSEVALLLRVTRAGLLREVGQAYVLTAKAKGASPDRVLGRHALPNALLPVVTVIGGRIGFLVSGAVLVESVFAWPGLGRLLVEAAQTGDHPVILGMVLLVSFSVIMANLLTDLAYAWIDPRIRAA